MSSNLVNIGSLRTIVRINFETRMRTHDSNSNIPSLSQSAQREIDEALDNREITDITDKNM